MQIIEEMLSDLLKFKASGVEKCINDVATLKDSRKKCDAVLKRTDLPSGVLDCLCSYLRMSIEAVDALSQRMASLGDKLSPQQEGFKCLNT